MSVLVKLMNYPHPIRKILRVAIHRLGLGSKRFRYEIGATGRSNYAYLVFQAARLAHQLGHKRVSVLEFGVAGGVGLLWLEYHAAWIEKIFPVKIEIYGFDTGEGLPPPQDYRDLPYHWKSGFFHMDKAALESRLTRAKLVLGDVRETVSSFFETYDPAPIGAVSHDMDFYSSTVVALDLFDAPDDRLLPRVFCYFDDVIGDDISLYCDYTGERAAILDFNTAHSDRKLGFARHLSIYGCERWRQQIWILHLFKHKNYNSFVSDEGQQASLNKRYSERKAGDLDALPPPSMRGGTGQGSERGAS
jgi:hypothetical protein